MKTAEQIATEVLSKLPTRLKGEIVSWDPLIDTAVIEAMREYAKECAQKLKDEIYIVLDTDHCKYEDQVMSIYSWDGDAESCRMMYESSVAQGDENRFKIITDKVL